MIKQIKRQKSRENETNFKDTLKTDTIKRVLNYIGAYRWLVLLSLLLSAVTVALTLYMPILIGEAVDLITGPGKVDLLNYIGAYRWLVLLSLLLSAVTVALTLYMPILIGEAVDLITGPGKVDFSRLFRMFGTMAAIILAAAAAQWLMNAINNHITYKVAMDVRDKAFCRLEILPLKYIDSHPHGDILSRIITDVDQFSDGLLMGFTQLFSGALLDDCGNIDFHVFCERFYRSCGGSGNTSFSACGRLYC